MKKEMKADLRHIAYDARKDVFLAQELYWALCSGEWSRNSASCNWSKKEAAEAVAQMRNESGCPDEDADDYLQLQPVSYERALQRLQNLGYTFKPNP